MEQNNIEVNSLSERERLVTAKDIKLATILAIIGVIGDFFYTLYDLNVLHNKIFSFFSEMISYTFFVIIDVYILYLLGKWFGIIKNHFHYAIYINIAMWFLWLVVDEDANYSDTTFVIFGFMAIAMFICYCFIYFRLGVHLIKNYKTALNLGIIIIICSIYGFQYLLDLNTDELIFYAWLDLFVYIIFYFIVSRSVVYTNLNKG